MNIFIEISPLKVCERMNYEKVKKVFDNDLPEPLTLNEVLDFISYIKANQYKEIN